jgi:hypothetical protein
MLTYALKSALTPLRWVLGTLSSEQKLVFDKLPLEVLVYLMTFLSREDVETLVSTMHMDFTGIIQYVFDNDDFLSPKRVKKLEAFRLDELSHGRNHSMINIVDIYYLDSLDIDRAVESLSGSYNIITAYRLTAHYRENPDYPSRLEPLIESFNKNSRIILNGEYPGCSNIIIRDLNLDLHNIVFQGIRMVTFENCGLKSGKQMQMTSTYHVEFVNCKASLLSGFNIRSSSLNTLSLWNYSDRRGSVGGVEVTDMAFKAESTEIDGVEEINDLFVEGKNLSLQVSDLENKRRCLIKGLTSPSIETLSISYNQKSPVIEMMSVPRLKSFSLIKLTTSDEFKENFTTDYSFLENIDHLTLQYNIGPLVCASMELLTILDLTLDENILATKVFLSLKVLHIGLEREANMVPEIKAPNLMSLSVQYFSEIEFMDSQSFNLLESYHHLESLSFKVYSRVHLDIGDFIKRNAFRWKELTLLNVKCPFLLKASPKKIRFPKLESLSITSYYKSTKLNIDAKYLSCLKIILKSRKQPSVTVHNQPFLKKLEITSRTAATAVVHMYLQEVCELKKVAVYGTLGVLEADDLSKLDELTYIAAIGAEGTLCEPERVKKINTFFIRNLDPYSSRWS